MASEGSFDFHVRLIDENDQLSQDDRAKLHFLFRRCIPRKIADDRTFEGTLDLFVRLFDQGSMSETEFGILIRAFQGIGLHAAARRLEEFQQSMQRKSNNSTKQVPTKTSSVPVF
ncbi:hypothetical protein I4U23_022891 [Adineta vaga]|nr:hypothetical protein I4U23_022891 [Adineta vaga]